MDGHNTVTAAAAFTNIVRITKKCKHLSQRTGYPCLLFTQLYCLHVLVLKSKIH